MRCECVSVAVLLWASGALANPPSKSDVAKLLKQTIKDVRSVSEVFADLGGGRHPVLFVTKGRDCIERTIDKEKEQNCSATSIPHLAIVKRGSALSLESELALPTANQNC